jgi:hypothetical protein
MKRLTEGQADIQRKLDLAQQAGVTPTPAVLHRILNADKIARNARIVFERTNSDMNWYRIPSQSGYKKVYTVMSYAHGGSCTCKDWKRHDRIEHRKGNPFSMHLCKHILGVKLRESLGVHP